MALGIDIIGIIRLKVVLPMVDDAVVVEVVAVVVFGRIDVIEYKGLEVVGGRVAVFIGIGLAILIEIEARENAVVIGKIRYEVHVGEAVAVVVVVHRGQFEGVVVALVKARKDAEGAAQILGVRAVIPVFDGNASAVLRRNAEDLKAETGAAPIPGGIDKKGVGRAALPLAVPGVGRILAKFKGAGELRAQGEIPALHFEAQAGIGAARVATVLKVDPAPVGPVAHLALGRDHRIEKGGALASYIDIGR